MRAFKRNMERNRKFNVGFFNGFYTEEIFKSPIPFADIVNLAMGYCKVYQPEAGQHNVSSCWLQEDTGEITEQKTWIESYGYDRKGSTDFGMKKEGDYIVLAVNASNLGHYKFLVDWEDYEVLLEKYG